MNKIENMATQQHGEEEVEKALVLWDISNCPIPDGYHPLMVVQRIQTTLEKSGRVRRYGENSITAIGNNLTEIPGEDVMRKLSSIGISLKHAHDYQDDLYEWANKNPPPATMMVIDGHEQLEDLASSLSDLEHEGYKIILAYPQRDLATPFSFTNQWDWDALLSSNLETTITTTTTTRLVNKCNDYLWSCSECFVSVPTFEDFTTHLKSVEHEFGEWDRYSSKYSVDRTNPANLPFGRSKELDSLLTQEMLRCQEMVSGKCQPGGFRPKYRSNSQSEENI